MLSSEKRSAFMNSAAWKSGMPRRISSLKQQAKAAKEALLPLMLLLAATENQQLHHRRLPARLPASLLL